MSYIVMDFETYYDRDYSLRKMTPAEYIFDPRFEVLGCAVKSPYTECKWLTPNSLRNFIEGLKGAQQGGEKITVIMHNALFDACILAWRYDFVPDLIVDTMGMARSLIFPFTGKVSLEACADYFNLPPKGDAIKHVSGMREADIRAKGLWDTYVEYGLHDARLTEQIFLNLARLFPREEYVVMDMVLRCAIQPQFMLDLDMLCQHKVEIEQQKELLLQRCGLTSRVELMSNDKFADALRALGIEPPTKMSPTTGRSTYSFAKSDPAMIELSEHPNPQVQALIAARVGHKSTLEETRTQRLINIALLDGLEGKAPIPLRYSGAHTHRLSGEWKMNCMHPDVELLTPNGWQRVEDWQPETPIMQWWPDASLTWEKSPSKVERDTNAELVWFNDNLVKGGFTRDHRMVSLRYDGSVKEHTAGWVADHSGLDRVPTGGKFAGGSSSVTPNMIRLIVAATADGSRLWALGPRTKGQSRENVLTNGIVFGFHKTRKADRLRTLLQNNDILYNEWTNGKRIVFTVRERNCPSWLKKGFGSWLLELPAEVMDAFLNELVHWDGFENNRSGNTTFCTAKKEEAEWVQTVAHLRGIACTVRAYKSNKQWYAYFRNSNLTSINNTKAAPYEGKTYCPQVASSYVLVRYGGGVFVTGQCQNWPKYSFRADGSKETGKLRRAHMAPPGYKVVKCDAAQIEARIVAWLAGQDDLTQAFAKGEDIYSDFAQNNIYHYPVDKNTVDERFVGKQGILGLGFQAGPQKFVNNIAAKSYEILGRSIVIPLPMGIQIVDAYRRRFPRIPKAWDELKGRIPVMAQRPGHVFGPCRFEKEAVLLPNGHRLFYPELQFTPEGNNGAGEWRFKYGPKTKRLFGGKLYENIVQALARILTMGAAVRMRKLYPQVPLSHQVHDDLVYIVPDALVPEFRQALRATMCETPDWAAGLPLDAEAAVGQNYGDAY